MVTNEERKQIAARMRQFKTSDTSSPWDYLEKLDEIIGLDYSCEETGERLADLIEPEPERTCKPHGEWERTSQLQECQRVLCDCGHELGMDTRRGFPIKIVNFCELPNYCPNCGARVVDLRMQPLNLADLIEPEERVLTLTPGEICPECNKMVGIHESCCCKCSTKAVK